jgi:putative ABC transport system permease protein
VTLRLPYSLLIIWRERHRFLPAILGVAFSGQLITLQVGLLIGTVSVLSLPIDRTSADVWVTSPEVLTLEMGHPIPEAWTSRVAGLPEVSHTEVYLYTFAYWRKPRGGSEVCCVIGSRLDEQAIGALRDLSPELRARLTEPGAVVVDEAECDRFGIRGVGDMAEVFGVRVRVVGLVRGFKSVGGPFVFCSLRTARLLLPLFRERPQDTMYLLVRCRSPEEAPRLVERLRQYPDMSAFTADDFSRKTRTYWLTQTRAGLGMGFTAALSLLVGLLITSQTLYAAVASSLREYAVLQALGIPRWRMAALVLAQSFWIGIGGVMLALPAILGLGTLANSTGAKCDLPPWLLAAGAAATMLTALLSGLAALRSLRQMEPMTLLR